MDLLLVVDVGNTNTVFGVYSGDSLVADFRVETRRNRTEDEYYALLSPLFARAGHDITRVTGMVVSSVVPPANYPLARLSERLCGKRPLVVDHRMDVGVKLLYHRPEEMGADRLVNAAWAWRRHGASIIVDFGTATTFDVVSAQGEYLGGCIVPGINISMDALFVYASRLPRVEVARPERTVGRSTEEAMRSGVYFGYVSMVDGLVDRIRQELGLPLKVIATGGLAKLIARDSRTIEVVEPNLALEGMFMLARLAREGGG